MRTMTFLLAVLLLTGCGTKAWTGRNLSEASLRRDSYECLSQNASRGTPYERQWIPGLGYGIFMPLDKAEGHGYEACMRARGYERNGPRL